MTRRFALLHALIGLLATTAQGQTPADLIRGRVTDDSAMVVAGASVLVTRGPDRALKQTTTDSSGRYSLTFDDGTGDYLVAIQATGYRTARRRVQRQGDELELVADFVLGRDAALLATVKVTATKPVRASNRISPFSPETGASEKWSDGVDGQLAPTTIGNLNALAGTMPGVTLGPNGPSILGSGGESNLTTLNGMSLGGGSLPRAARTETRVTGATFDPTRGGFSGANLDVRLGAGDRSYQQRNAFFTIDTPRLQFTDAVGRATGERVGSFRGSAGADGELIRQTLTYNIALDVSRTESDPATLLTGDPFTFALAGADVDSVARLVHAASVLGIPLSGVGVPRTRQSSALTWLGRLDDIRDSLRIRTLTTYAAVTTDGAQDFGIRSAPAVGSERRGRTLGIQLQTGDYVGAGRRVLTQGRLGWNAVRTEQDPYSALPGVQVQVRSLDGISGAPGDVTALSIGGGAGRGGSESRWTVEGASETFWNAKGRRHSFKALAWGRSDGLRQEGGGDLLGRYTYRSIADLEAGLPASYSRTLLQPARDGAVWNAAGALAHQWTPSRWFGVLYGARVEGNGFVGAPASNPTLEQALGVRSGLAPGRVHVSPRVGFSWTYNRDKDNGNGSSNNSIGRFYRSTSGVVRGGIGEFRDLLRPDILADAAASTGLPGGTELLSCVGSGVPTPDWSDILNSPATLPSRCTDGSGPLAERAPSVLLIDPRYDVPRSWRASLDWNGNVGPWTFKVGALGSYDLSQPGTVDANFDGTPRFVLDGESDRPVFVTPSAIDPASGAVSAAESRRSGEYGRVAVRTSQLHGYGGQLTFQFAPDPFKFRRVPGQPFVSLAYTLQSTRREFRGFDGGGFGDPREREWGPSNSDARHALILQGGVRPRGAGVFTLFARAQSGLPFTPIVQGDVNGDGRSGDRAFVPDVALTGDPETAAQLRALLTDGSDAARECVEAFAGRAARRNGCRGPWSSTLNAQWRPPIPRRLASRLQATVYMQNVLGGVDQLLHGGDGLKGWGAPATVDPVLLIPRGFDAGTRRFAYDVNPRFADTRVASTLVRNPFRVTIDFSLRLSTDYNLQELRRALEPVRVQKRWERRTADSLAAFYLNNTSDIHRALLAESDSLFLSQQQVAALRRADSSYVAQVRSVFMPLGDYLSRFGDGVATKAALDSVSTARKAYWQLFWQQPDVADSIITPTQRSLMPMLTGMLQVPPKDREHSQWFFGFPVKFRDDRADAVGGGRR
ncbi:MAG: carboxypeptidase-like regulatory domain-containing protein [Gemmatimonadota bacterium]